MATQTWFCGVRRTRCLLPLAAIALLALFIAVLAAPDGAQAADPATVTSVAITSTPKSGDTYGGDETIQVTATFSEAVTVTGVPFLRLAVGSSIRQVDYASGSGTAALVFNYTVIARDKDADGVSIPENPIIRASADDAVVSIRSAGGVDANPNHPGLPNQASHKVDGALDRTDPTIIDVRIWSPYDEVEYTTGDVIAVRVGFDERIVVTGTPTLSVTIGAKTRTFNYTPRSDFEGAIFEYTVTADDSDTDGISVPANSLDVPAGASIKDPAGNTAVVTHRALTAQAGYKVNVGGL